MLENISDLISRSANCNGGGTAIRYKGSGLDYVGLHVAVSGFAFGIRKLGLHRNDRVAIFADKQPKSITAFFGTCAAGGIAVPINGLLKPKQVAHILNDCDVRYLVTTIARAESLLDALRDCISLQSVVLIDEGEPATHLHGAAFVPWDEVAGAGNMDNKFRTIASDIAAILYTSGSTGRPKGVILSHANLLIGAESVAAYIGNNSSDRILAVLPVSFDAGLSQLTTGFASGACVVLHDYLLPRDVVGIVERERITGITAVPPLWIQLAGQKWPDGSAKSIRYFANTGGKMPRSTLARLRAIFPNASPFLMYGLTESFRSTYLPPAEVDTRPDSIGKAIPNVEVMVVGADGKRCGAGEVGELVHRGPLVSLGYWNDPQRTAARFRPVPGQPDGLPSQELGVWSGDSVTMDEDGFLYFVGRMDDMIKTSGYRVSPSEIEEIAYATGLVAEVAAIGSPHDSLGQGIVLVATAAAQAEPCSETLIGEIRPHVPNYMVPHHVEWRDALPRNANGKLDRHALADELADVFRTQGSQ